MNVVNTRSAPEWGPSQRQTYGTPALLVKTAAKYAGAANYEDEALLAGKALNASSLNILAQK
jgi:hypothetical protein